MADEGVEYGIVEKMELLALFAPSFSLNLLPEVVKLVVVLNQHITKFTRRCGCIPKILRARYLEPIRIVGVARPIVKFI